MRFVVVPALLLLCFMGVGCNRSEEGGKPGTAESFRLRGPFAPVELKQGDRASVSVRLSRGSSFRGRVALEARSSSGLVSAVSKPAIEPLDPNEFFVTITATPTAPLTDNLVTVFATPDTGVATSIKIWVQITPGPKVPAAKNDNVGIVKKPIAPTKVIPLSTP